MTEKRATLISELSLAVADVMRQGCMALTLALKLAQPVVLSLLKQAAYVAGDVFSVIVSITTDTGGATGPFAVVTFDENPA